MQPVLQEGGAHGCGEDEKGQLGLRGGGGGGGGGWILRHIPGLGGGGGGWILRLIPGIGWPGTSRPWLAEIKLLKITQQIISEGLKIMKTP